MGIEEQIDRLIDLGEDIKGRLDLLVEQGVMLKQPVGDRFVLPPESEMNSITFGEAIKKAKNHFADADKMVAEEPAKEPEAEHPAGPMPEPGDGYRILSKEPLEDLTPGDEFEDVNGEWIRSSNAETDKKQGATCWYRRKIEVAKEPVDHLAVARISPGEWLDIRDAYRDATPADVGRLVYVRNGELEPWIELRLAEVTGADFPYRCTKDGLDPTMWQAFRYAVIRNERPASKAEPSWEPKVGDWVRVTRPENWKEWKDPLWREEMHIYDGKVFEFVKWSQWSTGQRASLQGIDWFFHRDWLSPAEPPASEKPAELEYREPVLPADCGKPCEFSDDSISWEEGVLIGWRANFNTFNWKSERDSHRYARIKKDA